MANINIDKLLKRYKLEQKDLAESTGINKNTINKYFNNKFENINRTHIDLICKYFKCTPNDIFEIDDTVEVTPAKILYYDDKTNEFSYGEIAHAIISPLTWVGSKIVKGTIESTTKLPLENSAKQSEVFEEPNVYYSEEFVDPLAHMSPSELAEIKKISMEYQIRFEKELELDGLVSNFIDEIINSLLLNFEFDKNVKQTLENFKGYDYFKTKIKVDKFYDSFYRFFNFYSEDKIFVELITTIKNIYTISGLEKLSDEKIIELINSIKAYISNNKQKD
jgi:putative transcriptional regulator